MSYLHCPLDKKKVQTRHAKITVLQNAKSDLNLGYKLYLSPDTTEQSDLLETNIRSASREICGLLWSPKIILGLHKNPTFKIHFNIILTLTSSDLFPSSIPTKILYAAVISCMRTACPALGKPKHL
jgi:hypothetical protein